MDIYKIARYAYKIGAPIFSDSIYDRMETVLKNMYPDERIFNTSYEDDNEPTDLLEKYNITLQGTINKKNYYVGEASSALDVLPISQRPVRTKEDAYQWYKQHNNELICHTLKVDGISTRILMSKNTTLVQEAYSKGRTDVVTDFTKTIKKKLNKGMLGRIRGSEGNIILVAAEGIIDDEGVKFLSNSLTPYKNGRSAALGILSTDIHEDVLPHLRLFAFDTSQVKSSYIEQISALEKLGFEIVPSVVDTFVDNGFESFSDWIDNITAQLHTKAIKLGIQADGVVARLDNLASYNKAGISDLYSDGSIALKFNEFQAKVYVGTVKDISFEFEGNSSENYTTKITLEPLKTDDNKTITKITGYNLSYLISKGITVGSNVNVLYQSGCYPMLG
jgi:NAD-dependent DNA ligase